MGQKLCQDLHPSSDISEITHMQTETHDALNRLFKKGHISFGGAKDIRGSLKRLEIGSSLNIPELLQVAGLLETPPGSNPTAVMKMPIPPGIPGYSFDSLEPLTPLSTEIRRCIVSEDEVSDDASPTLKQIRRSIRAAGDKIHTQLNSLVNGSYRTYLQDAVITMRDGRYCIPVKSEYKSQVRA